MYFQKSMVIHRYIHDFGMSVIHTSVDIHIDIQAGLSEQGHSAMDIREQ